MRFYSAILVFFLSTLPGFAHSPYFSTWACQSDEGYVLRLFYGDGIIGPDPASVVALDSDGHLLAYSQLGMAAFHCPERLVRSQTVNGECFGVL